MIKALLIVMILCGIAEAGTHIQEGDTVSSNQDWTGTNTFSNLICSGQQTFAYGTGVGYGVVSPSAQIDFECSGDGGSAIDCAFISHSAGIALDVRGTDNSQAINAVNGYAGTPTSAGAWAAAIKASNSSQLSAIGVASFFQTAASTATLISATTGTGLIVKSNSGTAVEIDAGALQLAPKTLAQLQSLTPRDSKQIFFCADCTTDAICVSTGTGQGAWVRASARTTACN